MSTVSINRRKSWTESLLGLNIDLEQVNMLVPHMRDRSTRRDNGDYGHMKA
jgi:hypothetical protein